LDSLIVVVVFPVFELLKRLLFAEETLITVFGSIYRR